MVTSYILHSCKIFFKNPIEVILIFLKKALKCIAHWVKLAIFAPSNHKLYVRKTVSSSSTKKSIY